MRFGPVPLSEAEGGILAHSIAVDGARLKKGRVLRSTDVATLAAAGIAEVTIARTEPGDMGEDAAAATIAAALVPDPAACGLTVSAPFTGRVNFFAGAAGVLRIAAGAVDALNRIDPAITLATLSDHARVQPRQMVATVKIIPYGVPGVAVVRACGAVDSAALRLHPFRDRPVSLILTRTPGMKPSLVDKGRAAVEARLTALGLTLHQVETVQHETAAVAAAVAGSTGGLVLILSGSATSDANDTCPAGLKAAGGHLTRFGMPVDPGNLLFIGEHAGRPVLGLPGCARSPALNGADWVLERLAADLPVTDEDIAAMGVGGLLKEIPSRPQPRAGHAAPSGRPRIEAILLAAGAARRMEGRDKLLEPVGDQPILRVVAEAARASQADRVIAVLPPGAEARRAALAGLALDLVEAPDWAEGMAASLRAGLAAVSPEAEAVVILLADMPEVASGHIDRLLAAFDPEEGREICRAVSETGVPGHPVLFGRRFFESLLLLTGDRGARELLRDAPEFVTDVPTPGEGAAIDLDTPEAWEAWRVGRPD